MENKVRFGGVMTAQINFAMTQNYVPVFRIMVLENITDTTLNNVRLRIAFEPDFAESYESAPLTLRPGELTELSPVETPVKTEYLFALTEKISGFVRIDALIGEEVIARELRNIELLAYDQWTGSGFMPETAAAFMTPNHPRIAAVIAKAGEYLNKWDGDPAFTGYQKQDPNAVRRQMAAVYAALQEENIAYSMPPASFEGAQRIRMPDTVLNGKTGTCLDLAVLYCTCLEAAGLNPLLILTKTHAFAGCWLENDTFPDIIQYDGTALTKRFAEGINAISVVECTAFTAGKSMDFERSVKTAETHFKELSEFEEAVDVRRARDGGIRPIPSRVEENGSIKAVDYGVRERDEITSAPSDLIVTDFVPSEGQQKEITKQIIWERKLLDLSLRNSLLNFRPTSMNVQLLADDLGVLEDRMAGGEEFMVMPMPEDTSLTLSDSMIYQTENSRELIADIARGEFEKGRLRTCSKEAELDKVMKKLHRLAKVSLEENGANTMYLALGFLKWYETDRSEKARYAPIVLVPIDIIKKVQDNAYSIRVRDEETQVNITVLEMLRQFFGIDIGGLDPVPEDENGVDLMKIFTTVRSGIMSRPRWEIEDYAFIGQFSFNRFIMWNDIKNRSEDLKRNKVVASLIDGETKWESNELDTSPLELDRIDPRELAVPVAADSSQLAAVAASAKGESFVLHGAPGTGKSQTITNMIATALYNGKSVLFVAEKMAALSVVEKRLNKVGLGPFCLELHSNKAQKRSVLNQLDEVLNVGRIKKPADYEQEAKRLYDLRQELNKTMDELHKVRSFGLSVNDAAVRYQQNKAFEGQLDLTREQVASLTPDTFREQRETLESLSAMGAEFGDAAGTPLKPFSLTSCTPQTMNELRSLLSELDSRIGEVESDGFFDKLAGEGLTFDQTCYASELARAAMGDGCILSSVLSDTQWEMKKTAVLRVGECGREYSALKNEVLGTFEASVLDYDSASAQRKYKEAQGKWFLPKSMKTKKLVKELSSYAKSPSSVTKGNIASHYEKLNRLSELMRELKEAPQEITAYYGGLYLGAQSDWEAIGKAAELSQKLRDMIAASPLPQEQRERVISALPAGYGDPGLKAQNSPGAQSSLALLSKVQETLSALRDKYSTDTAALTAGEGWTEYTRPRITAVINALPQLKEWTVIVSLCNKLGTLGIKNAADAYLDGRIQTKDLVRAYDCGSSKAMVTAAISDSPELSSFQGTMFEDTVRKLSETHDRFQQLTIQELAAKLSANVPEPGSASGSSELGILQKAIKSGGRMMSIRKLFDSIPGLLRRLCPVMLMSPISVAQYIDPAYPQFDLVVFDLASQLPPCEAVGAIARGENVIVVGDPKQLPPTSFFTSNQTDEENYEKEDLESVLDDCLALSMPQKHLQWHYRSRHESLIAYSNAKYYDNKLYTFPSPEDIVSEVSWVHVEGWYDKGGTKQNKAEAAAIVEELCRRLRDPELRKQSVGVVTFSMPQQNLIDDMLSDAFRAEPKLEEYANELPEPIFIKNLENVQGDERDVILFSVGYGPDKEGKVSMNFGPLNKDGGWRRLNVAISRSSQKMVVYSTIAPEQIDLTRTRSEGVEGLRGFLEFAARGRSALPVRAGANVQAKGFEVVVAAELEKLGYKVRTKVGCSDFRMDAAVVNPEDPDRYILGINCLSEQSYLSGTAYDRSVSQPSVLKGLGWNVTNVYIVDWLYNKAKVLTKIENEINAALELYRDPSKAQPEPEKPKQALVFEREEPSDSSDIGDEYETFTIKKKRSSDKFTEQNSKDITALINDILATEAPVSAEVLKKEVFNCYDIARPGAVMKKAFDKALADASAYVTQPEKGESFVWLSKEQQDTFDKCRVRYKGERRTLDEVAPEEIANGIELILGRQLAMSRDDLVREIAHLFGFPRVSPTIENAAALGIKVSRSRGRIAFGEDGRVIFQ